jgi:hypothetical protein
VRIRRDGHRQRARRRRRSPRQGVDHPGKVFDLALPLDQVADGYRAMDERRVIKAFLAL